MSSPLPVETPEVGIVVVAYNTKGFWPRLRAAVEAQTYKKWRLVIIDNASSQDQRLAQSDLPDNAILIQSDSNIGFAAANNRAAAMLKTPFIALLNPDAFPATDWLEELVAASRRWPQAAAIGSLQLMADNPELCDGDGDEMHVLGVPYRAYHGAKWHGEGVEGPCFSACAAAALYRASAFHAARGFDERFFSYCEDVDLGYRLRLAGHLCVQAPRAVVHHVSGASASRRSAFAMYHGFRNRLWVFVKNTPGWLFWPTILPHLLVTMSAATAYALKGHGLHAWRGLSDALRSAREIWHTRNDIQRERTASTLAIASALVWSPMVALRRTNKRRQR